MKKVLIPVVIIGLAIICLFALQNNDFPQPTKTLLLMFRELGETTQGYVQEIVNDIKTSAEEIRNETSVGENIFSILASVVRLLMLPLVLIINTLEIVIKYMIPQLT